MMINHALTPTLVDTDLIVKLNPRNWDTWSTDPDTSLMINLSDSSGNTLIISWSLKISPHLESNFSLLPFFSTSTVTNESKQWSKGVCVLKIYSYFMNITVVSHGILVSRQTEVLNPHYHLLVRVQFNVVVTDIVWLKNWIQRRHHWETGVRR